MPVAQMAICMYLMMARMMAFQGSQGLANGAVTLEDKEDVTAEEGTLDMMVLQVMRGLAAELTVIWMLG
jgi:hypothetical protein